MGITYPIAAGPQVRPWGFDSKMLIGYAHGEKRVGRWVAPDRLLNDGPAQMRPQAQQIFQPFGEQHRVWLSQHRRRAVNVTLNSAATRGLVPVLKWLLEAMQPEIVVKNKVTRKY